MIGGILGVKLGYDTPVLSILKERVTRKDTTEAKREDVRIFILIIN